MLTNGTCPTAAGTTSEIVLLVTQFIEDRTALGLTPKTISVDRERLQRFAT